MLSEKSNLSPQTKADNEHVNSCTFQFLEASSRMKKNKNEELAFITHFGLSYAVSVAGMTPVTPTRQLMIVYHCLPPTFL